MTPAKRCWQPPPLLESGSVTVHKEDLAETFALITTDQDVANGHDVLPADEQAAPPASRSPRRWRRPRHFVLDLCIVAGVIVVYLLSLLGYHWLATAPGPLPEPDLSTADNSVVVVRIEALHAVEHRLDVKVLVMPDDSMINKRLNVLTTDTSVRFFPQNDLGDLQYPVGKSPAQVA